MLLPLPYDGLYLGVLMIIELQESRKLLLYTPKAMCWMQEHLFPMLVLVSRHAALTLGDCTPVCALR